MIDKTQKARATGKDLLIKSIRQVIGILLATNALILLTEAGIFASWGWRCACIMLLALGIFCLRIFGAIAWASLRQSHH